MSNGQQPQGITRQELEAKIVAKAWTDEDFRRKFLADPKSQFEEHLGISLPDALVMTAHQEDANHLHFVIPAKPPGDLDELSDEELEKVAGGIGVITWGLIMSAILGTAMAGSLAVTFTVGGVVSASVGAGTGWGTKSD